MKAEINEKNRAAFLATYFGQNLIPSIDGEMKPVVSENITPNTYLRLRMPSHLSVAEGCEIEKILGHGMEKGVVVKLLRFDGEVQNKFVEAVDMLRSFGIAIPWRGLSIQDLIDAKWIVLEKSPEEKAKAASYNVFGLQNSNSEPQLSYLWDTHIKNRSQSSDAPGQSPRAESRGENQNSSKS